MNSKLRMRCAIGLLSAIMIGFPVLAVETGTGTNQMGNVHATNSINLQGSIITSWTQVGSTADVAMVSNVAYGLDSRSNTWDGTAVTATGAYNLATGLEARSNAWNTGAAQAAGLNSRSNTWDAASLLAIGLETRSNVWNTGAAQAAGLDSRSNTWDAASLLAIGLETRSNAWNTGAAQAAGLTTRSNAWDNAVIIRGVTAGTGVTISFSNLYFFSGGVWSNANASTNDTAKGLLGLALGVAADGLLLNGYCTNAWGFPVGSIVYMDTNDGALASSRPTGTNNVVRIVGYAVSDSQIYFNPDRTYIEITGQ